MFSEQSRYAFYPLQFRDGKKYTKFLTFNNK
jgi:hypothetical protein